MVTDGPAFQDSSLPTTSPEASCAVVTLALQYVETQQQVLEIDSRLWNHPKQSPLSRAVLLLHESLYRVARASGQTDSSRTRILVGNLITKTPHLSSGTVLDWLESYGFAEPTSQLMNYSDSTYVGGLIHRSLWGFDFYQSNLNDAAYRAYQSLLEFDDGRFSKMAEGCSNLRAYDLSACEAALQKRMQSRSVPSDELKLLGEVHFFEAQMPALLEGAMDSIFAKSMLPVVQAVHYPPAVEKKIVNELRNLLSDVAAGIQHELTSDGSFLEGPFNYAGQEGLEDPDNMDHDVGGKIYADVQSAARYASLRRSIRQIPVP
jgi:hypothetical protein